MNYFEKVGEDRLVGADFREDDDNFKTSHVVDTTQLFANQN